MTEDSQAAARDGAARPSALRHVEAVVNVASGSVGAGAGEALRAMLSERGIDARVSEVRPPGIGRAVEAAVKAAPDLVVVLAGDGTARFTAELCGPDGPMVAPLPGGTMNMLPKAIFGTTDWKAAAAAMLDRGVERTVSGGEVGGKAFYVAAILGAPALWADAREAVRAMKLWLAVLRARRACERAFSGKLRFDVGEGPRRAEALTLMCPLVSRILDREQALEADALDPQGVTEAFRLGLRAAFSGFVGDWRDDPAVTTALATQGRAWAKGRIPAILDGEPQRFPREVSFRFLPAAFRTFAPVLEPPPEKPEAVISDSVRKAL